MFVWHVLGSFLVLLLIDWIGTTTVYASIPEEEITALFSLYNSTRGELWEWKAEDVAGSVWNFTVDNEGNMDNPCRSSSLTAPNSTWQGIACSDVPSICTDQLCHVTAIRLGAYQLSGKIPSDISFLSHLQVISLSNNQLTGTIPTELKSLTSLNALNLFRNFISGVIPGEIGALNALSLLDLDLNYLTGAIPSQIVNLTALGYLDISSNMLTGSIPAETGNSLKLLQLLDVSHNLFSGSIPREVAYLNRLQYLNLFSNQLTGTLPEEIGLLTSLVQIFVANNRMTGSIPSAITHLTSLEIITLNSNQFSGRLPYSFGALSKISLLSLHYNAITGSIPTSLGKMTALSTLNLYANRMTGCIEPEVLRNLTKIESAALSINQFTGTIPNEISLLTSLTVLAINDNQLSGPIPPMVGELKMLTQLFMHNNHLSGVLPSTVGELTALSILTLHENFLTGTISSKLGKLVELQIFHVRDNLLSGSIPDEIGRLTSIQQLTLSLNHFTGNLPDSIYSLVYLRLLGLHDNLLHGPIAAQLGNLIYLETLSLASNFFTGTMPKEIGLLLKLSELYFQSNTLTGLLPSDLANMKQLQSLFLQGNIFSGYEAGAFNYSTQTALRSIDVSENVLEGSLPSELFLLPKLGVVSLSVNCFNEELPTSICNARHVEVLSLNGLQAAGGCANVITVPLTSVKLRDSIGGSIPSCIWDLRNLTVLHLTGNGLSGQLPHELNLASQIFDLSLSHNQLSGTIPHDVLRIQKLDLSHNKFSGEFENHSRSYADSVLNLEINRISGNLPEAELNRVENGALDVLRGNIISCNTIPRNDNFADDYICGSENLDESLIIFATMAGIVVTIFSLAAILLQIDPIENKLMGTFRGHIAFIWLYATYVTRTNDMSQQKSPALRSIASITDAFVQIITLAVKLLSLILILSIPIYFMKLLDYENRFATHSNTYSWFWTLAFMRGPLPAGILLVSWILIITACFYYIVVPTTIKCCHPLDDATVNEPRVNKIGYWSLGFAFFFNACITITVNALYIYATQQALGAFILFIIQLSLSVFRLLYVAVMFPLLANPIHSVVKNIRFRFFLLVINNLLIPCIVTALTSDACFQGLLIPPDEISTPYSIRTCIMFASLSNGETVCTAYSIEEGSTSSLVPPFSYSNQCGSVVLTSYIPVFILSYSIQLLVPILILISMTCLPYETIPPCIRSSFHGIFSPTFWLKQNVAKCVSNPNGKDMLKISTIYCNDVFNNALVILTFGLCSPVLALAVACAAVLKLSLWVVLVGRFTFRVMNAGQEISDDPKKLNAIVTMSDDVDKRSGTEEVPDHIALVELAAAHIPLHTLLAGSLWGLIFFSAFFIALLCWEISSDDIGLVPSLWALLFPLFYAVLLRVIAWKWQNDSVIEDSKFLHDKDIPVIDSMAQQSPLHLEIEQI